MCDRQLNRLVKSRHEHVQGPAKNVSSILIAADEDIPRVGYFYAKRHSTCFRDIDERSFCGSESDHINMRPDQKNYYFWQLLLCSNKES